jgi:hypothetical protein
VTHFSDDLYLGNAKLTPGDPLPAPGANPPAGGFGVGPLGRIYVWDTVAVVGQTNNIVTAAAIGAGLLAVLTAGTGATQVTTNRGEVAIQADVPRNVQITASGNEAARVVTVLGYDRYGQRMSEDFSGLNANTVQGKKAFYQVIQVSISSASVANISAGFGAVLGSPVAFTDRGYLVKTGFNNVLAQDAGTATVADATSPATTTTGDVRGTYTASGALDGSKRLVVTIAIPGIGAGPNATRIGAFGVDQNLAAT